MANEVSTKIDIQYAEKKIIFLICDCSLHKDYSFWKLSRNQAEMFIERLKYIEQLDWNQFSNLGREKGITSEISGTDSYEIINEQNTSPEKFIEQYYFHFRIKHGEKFRVFGYQKRQYFCITHIDYEGKIHGHN